MILSIKTMKTSLASFLIALCLMNSAWAEVSRSDCLQVQRQVEERVNPILRFYEPESFVIVTALPMKEKEKVVPGTPFLMKVQIQNTDSSVLFEKLILTVYTKSGTLPESVTKILSKLASGFGATPTFQYESLPASFFHKTSKADDSIESKSAKKDIAEIPKDLPKDLKELSKEVPEDQASAEKTKPQGLGWIDQMSWGLQLKIAGGMFLLSILVFGLYLNQSSAFRKSINQGLRTISTALEAQALEGGSQAAAVSTSLRSQDLPGSLPARQDTSSENSVARYSLESLVACFSDCYWSKSDHYAAYLWKQTPVLLKKQMIDQVTFLSSYSFYLNTLEGVDLGFLEEPTYLNPIQIEYFDNSTVTDLVRKNYSLMKRLSSLRLQGLSLGIQERLELHSKAQALDSSAANEKIDIKGIKKSPLRALPSFLKIEIQSLDQEIELLQSNHISMELIEAVPSLIWANRLSTDELSQLLSPWSARDLASAWIGPEETLKLLGGCIADKKLKLVSSMLKNVPPSRKSVAFNKIHRLMVEKIKSKEEKNIGEKI